MWPFISNPTSFELSHLNQKGFASNSSTMMHFLCICLKSLIRSQNLTITAIPTPEALTTVFCRHLLHCQFRASRKTTFLGIASLPCILRTSMLVSYGFCNKTPKVAGLKQNKFILSWFWKPEIQNGFHWAEIKASAQMCTFQRI